MGEKIDIMVVYECKTEELVRDHMKIKLPDNVAHIIERLEGAGYEAYAVGGCVRDSILGREPNDWDITTSALPEQVKELFSRTIDTGIKHGTVSILIGKETYEVTTYRVDGKYSDARRPDTVSFTRSLEEDLKRRDFTINAMAYNDRNGLVDMFDGAADLEKHIIRCVGVAHERFSEDALRILRAVRFASQLDFEIDVETRLAAAALAPNLALISAERIHAELDKLLLSKRPDMVSDMYALGISRVILPELDTYCLDTSGSDKTAEADKTDKANKTDKTDKTDKRLPELLFDSPAVPYIRWAILFASICAGSEGRTDTDTTGLSTGRDVMRRLKFDNKTIFMVSLLTDHKDTPITGLSDTEMRYLMHEVSKENVPLLLTFIESFKGTDTAGALEQYERIVSAGDCTSLKELAISGSDLIAHGFKAGSTLGDILDKLLDTVIREPAGNTADNLLAKAKELI